MVATTRIVLRPDVVRAYERTRYRVALDAAPFTLRIGERSAELADLHRAAGVATSAFVTACNPFGKRCSDAVNASAMQRLRAGFDRRGIRWIAGSGAGDDDGWAAEPSVLALGVSPHDAQTLCVDFEQNAVVVAGGDAIPRLLFHPLVVLGTGGE